MSDDRSERAAVSQNAESRGRGRHPARGTGQDRARRESSI